MTVRDLSGLARIATGLLLVQVAISALAAAIALAHGPGYDQPPEAGGSGVYLAAALVQLLVYVVTGIAVLRWIHLANRNAHAMGAQGMTTGPVMAVLWYFIPIATLFMPLQSMREMWKASADPRDWEVVRPPATLDWWWAFWLTAGITGISAFRLAGEGAGAARIGGQLTTASDLLTIPASLLMARIILQISAMQQPAAAPGLPPARIV